MPPAPSVSVIKDLREDADKTKAMEGWKDRYDGKSSWAQPWWKDQRDFKGFRGTLVHYTILSALAERAQTAGVDVDASGETYFHDVGSTGWGYEEYFAEYNLKKWSRKAPSANTDITGINAPSNNHHDGEHAWDKAVRGMTWAAKTFNEQFLEGGVIDPANVIAVEEYVCEDEHGYAGQYDLLYERADGTTVLCDLKTSSGIRFDHKLQTAAYAHAVEQSTGRDVDECEIIQLYPDDEVCTRSVSTEWDRSIDGLTHEFLGLVDTARVEYEHPLAEAKAQLTEHEQSTQQSLSAE
jgi:hypothetical protein